ncbi:CDP-diacylglycerol--glycerol-3-phosphate 3-phosphatidyltransferase [Candidatus Kinetoplastibacterium blastocrithidii TCC012E]|uniref:CDP-diacylglycerol--glycerol-3-phosphate 3-phosphatidyltransferase n=1 Tax=Candidatus Kinetoplastidibacterium blastocrithidiae TCC012E TaxID=1208922 RepID=M1LZY4_9PROT|nr:CDP-diacylglycerol--glycerol-3-phosphate 3-phosphatidyltransferase [Candidatus Kinetoplastibacterium blastocrithidii]AFZ83898.1 CDP-diacylglycerol--glycerol-3-phosphate 3-phosphatidyltransferase [Candidatus Kinetoplastibacterium blastocrithidii (ex Strigomonas culicis)]AGF49621.1 CDP-diacylglycerol--glycerol-3-phosphate 3-phosphatidyltransferase [Candidatus Kinetoplastibacterium blastocrithidii TCC012E]
MIINIPIVLTFIRIAISPLILLLFYIPNKYICSAFINNLAALLFILAAFTDWLDGWLARYLNQSTSFGAFLDPVADKIIVCTSLIVLLDLGRVSMLVALIIIGREIFISSLREWMARIGSEYIVSVHALGKLKTMFQMAAIPCLFYGDSFLYISFLKIGSLLIAVSSIFAVLSMLFYIKCSLPMLHREFSPNRDIAN